MKRKRELGAALAYLRADGGVFELPIECFDDLKAAWMAGKAFWEGPGFYAEDRVVIKLGEVCAVGLVTAAGIEEKVADDRANEKEDVVGGGS